MPRKQTRRAISLRPETYDQVKAYADENGQSMSGFVEALMASFFGEKKPAKKTKKAKNTPGVFQPSDLSKEKPATYEKPPLRGGGIHEL